MKKQTVEIKSGYIYCIYNPIFKYYSENTYKLCQTANLVNRINAYITCYIEKSEYKITSIELLDKNLADKLLFDELKNYRISSNREFFSCDFEIIKNAFNKIEKFFEEYNTLEKILKYYLNETNKEIDNKNIIDDIILIETKIDKEYIIKNLTANDKLFLNTNELLNKHINLQCYYNDKIYTTKTIKLKINLCKELMKILNINSFEDLNKDISKYFSTIVDNKWLTDNLISIIKTFKLSEIKYNTNEYYKLYQMYISIMTILFDKNLLLNFRVKINYKNYLYYNINNITYARHKQIIQNCK